MIERRSYAPGQAARLLSMPPSSLREWAKVFETQRGRLPRLNKRGDRIFDAETLQRIQVAASLLANRKAASQVEALELALGYAPGFLPELSDPLSRLEARVRRLEEVLGSAPGLV